jgi:hypothetical protein
MPCGPGDTVDGSDTSAALDNMTAVYHDIGMYSSVLFLCVANSARSQMAEGLARSRDLEASEVV